ncbi:hypothetical protein MTR_4g122840 [Medicago truncatula]|uniref:Retrovirus-related Pol polyprotein from transposon TNT 1-94-like beta-barrel domain-containing protein n=1 Tax=Medicago truncatula TaxID=3880 RepID=G7JPY8_MEDTR|nr:hypothetical protein MTR_4g122840 [Medicago truncatula]
MTALERVWATPIVEKMVESRLRWFWAQVELFFGQELGNISNYASSGVPTEHTTSSLSVKVDLGTEYLVRRRKLLVILNLWKMVWRKMKVTERWFLDTSCYNYMTRHKEWVKEIDTRKTTNVELENHTTLTIEGMRKYAVEMKDGKIVVTEGWKSICYAKGLFSDLKNNNLLEMPLPDGDFVHVPINCDLWVFREFLNLSAIDYVNDTIELWVIDIIGTNGGNVVKYNYKGQLLDHHSYSDDPDGSQVVMYTESLLSLPAGAEQV